MVLRRPMRSHLSTLTRAIAYRSNCLKFSSQLLMLFTSINFGSVNTTPRTQGRGDRSLIARSGIKSFMYSRMGVLRSNEGRSTRVHEYTGRMSANVFRSFYNSAFHTVSGKQSSFYEVRYSCSPTPGCVRS